MSDFIFNFYNLFFNFCLDINNTYLKSLALICTILLTQFAYFQIISNANLLLIRF